MAFLDILIPILAILASVALPIATGLVLGYTSMKNKHKERMGLISQGIIPPNTEEKKANPNRMVSLRNGIVLFAIGIGLAVGFILAQYVFNDGDNIRFWIVASSVLLFLGLGYVSYFMITKDMYDSSEKDTLE